MSIAYPDEQPGSTLRSRRESIEFTSDRAITEVRAVYDEELVYTEGGGFEPQYSQSTKNEAATSFSVKRNGGWQRTVTLHQDEEPAPVPTDGVPWGVVYDLDLTAQTSQPSIATGAFTVDGLQWWAKGSLSTGQSSALDSGQGLRLTTASGNLASFSQGNTISSRVFAFDPSQAPNFNPSAPWMIQWRLDGPNRNDAGLSAMCGICQATGLNGNAFQAAEWAGMFTLGSVDINNNGGRWWLGSGTNNVATISPVISTTVGDWAYGMMYINDSARVAMWGAWSAGFPTLNNMNRGFFLGQQASGSPVFVYCHRKTTNGVGDLITYLTHLRIVQPKNAA